MSTVDLAVIGNGMVCALLDGCGRYVWCCMDNVDGDAVFNCLINNNSHQTGFFDVVLEDFDHAEQTYSENTMVLITVLHSALGDSIEIRDFSPRFEHFDRLFRPIQFFRTIRRIRGDPRITIRVRPTFLFNSTDGYKTRGSQHVRYCGPSTTWRLTTNTATRHIVEELPFLLPLDPIYIVWGTDESFTNSLPHVAEDFESKTIGYWRTWCRSLCLSVEFQEEVVRAAMTMVVLQSEDCGGFVAALTMSLPLGPYCRRKTRDSRVCRILDECLALPVLREVGLFSVGFKLLVFLKELVFKGVDLQTTYSAKGGVSCKVREWAPYLAGYRGMGEVFSGGAPVKQQLSLPKTVADSAVAPQQGPDHSQTLAEDWQEKTMVSALIVLALTHAFFDIRVAKEICTPKLFQKLEGFAVQACNNIAMAAALHAEHTAQQGGSAWADQQKPSVGVGFFDDDADFLTFDPRKGEMEDDVSSVQSSLQKDFACSVLPVHTFTSVLCWAAADRLQRISEHYLQSPERTVYWQRRATELREVIDLWAWSPRRGAFTTYWGGEAVGPSLLRLAEIGYISPQDARFHGTLRAFEADAFLHAVCLSDGISPIPSSAPVGPGGAEKSAVVPAFPSACFMTNTLLWYCEALRSTGAVLESRRLLSSILRCSTHRGILSESVDLKTNELWGNVPAVSAHLSLLRVALRLSKSWRDL